jgi:hypothetical protein
VTPYEIDILLWYYTRPSDHPDMFRASALWNETRERFKRDELLHQRQTDHGLYALTERGECYVKSLLAVGLPTRQWFPSYPEVSK